VERGARRGAVVSTPRTVRPYGDKKNDGAVQLSFTLPVAKSAAAIEAAKRWVSKMGVREPYVTLAEAIAPEFTYFVVYGRATHEVDLSSIAVEEAPSASLDREAIDADIARRFGRRLIVLGCALESDAHTVGLDAIFNMKGFAGDYGLERYHGFDARNLGAQVPVAEVARQVRVTGADAVLVSATVTQNEIHIRHMTDLVDMLEAERLRDRVVLVAGGARVDHALAKELGYDAGFGPGTKPSRVAAFLLEEISRRHGVGNPA
jgi:beta-lysine 5,6-aminomutase beta subunit